jgi:hypothetical protein
MRTILLLVAVFLFSVSAVGPEGPVSAGDPCNPRNQTC